MSCLPAAASTECTVWIGSTSSRLTAATASTESARTYHSVCHPLRVHLATCTSFCRSSISSGRDCRSYCCNNTFKPTAQQHGRQQHSRHQHSSTASISTVEPIRKLFRRSLHSRRKICLRSTSQDCTRHVFSVTPFTIFFPFL